MLLQSDKADGITRGATMDTPKKVPYELLLQWREGKIAGAHVQWCWLMQDGSELPWQDLEALDLGADNGPLIGAILQQLQADPLARIAEHEATISAKDTELAVAESKLAEALFSVGEKDAQIARLREQLEAVRTVGAKALESAVDDWIEHTARDLGYGTDAEPATLSLASYVNSSVDLWQRQAREFIAWRDAVWQKCILIQSDVLAGSRPIPTTTELIAELPQPAIARS